MHCNREAYSCAQIRLTLERANVEIISEPTLGVRFMNVRTNSARPSHHAHAHHRVSETVAARTCKTRVTNRHPRAGCACSAMTRRGTPCARTALANGRCANHGGLSSGPKTAAGRARIAKAQRKRWAKWRAEREVSVQ
jgi:hypothetical protein